MSNTVRIGNQSINYEQAKDMLFPELIPQKGNEALLSAHPHDKVEDLAVLYRLDQFRQLRNALVRFWHGKDHADLGKRPCRRLLRLQVLSFR